MNHVILKRTSSEVGLDMLPEGNKVRHMAVPSGLRLVRTLLQSKRDMRQLEQRNGLEMMRATINRTQSRSVTYSGPGRTAKELGTLLGLHPEAGRRWEKIESSTYSHRAWVESEAIHLISRTVSMEFRDEGRKKKKVLIGSWTFTQESICMARVEAN